MKKILLATVIALTSVAVTQAGVISLVTTRVGSDSVNWNQLGPDNSVIPNPFSATSTFGIGVVGSFAVAGPSLVSVEGSDWFGNFPFGDTLVWTNSPGQGPLTLVLSKGVRQVGAQIQADFYGAFTAKIDAYNGATLLGSFTENGTSTSLEDGKAIYLGFADTAPEITRIVYSLATGVTDPADFAINGLSITQAAPEPGTLALLGGGLALAGTFRRRLYVR